MLVCTFGFDLLFRCLCHCHSAVFVPMEPKKKISHGESSSSHSRYDSHRFPTVNKAIHFENNFVKRNVGYERAIVDD